MSKKKSVETPQTPLSYPADWLLSEFKPMETTSLMAINPAAERSRQLRIIELLEEIAAKLGKPQEKQRSS
jgi:hypothetical protein